MRSQKKTDEGEEEKTVTEIKLEEEYEKIVTMMVGREGERQTDRQRGIEVMRIRRISTHLKLTFQL